MRPSPALFPFLPVLLCALLLACGGPPEDVDAGHDAGLDGGRTCSADVDCDDGLFCSGTAMCIGGRCVTPTLPCRDTQTCIESMQRCLTDCAVEEDADGDGVRALECGGADCDDTDRDRFPGAPEICDAQMRDEDCDPLTFGFRDGDGDGAADARCCNEDSAGLLHCGTDCDDAAPGVHPAVPEVCNGFDDDCDAFIDEGLVTHVTVDADGDGHGSTASDAPTMDVCGVPAGWAELADDCDDTNPDRYPGNPEVCDEAEVDEDCSGEANDVPGGCECAGTDVEVCGTVGRCTGATRRCSGGTWEPCTIVPATEVCDGSVDEDCDGNVDEELRVTCYVDNDRDGYASDSASPMQVCRASASGRAGPPWNGCPLGFTGRAPGPGAADCCDADERARPGGGPQGTASGCGGFDFNCDGAVTSGNPDFDRRTPCFDHNNEDDCEDETGGGWLIEIPACGETESFGGTGECHWGGSTAGCTVVPSGRIVRTCE